MIWRACYPCYKVYHAGSGYRTQIAPHPGLYYTSCQSSAPLLLGEASMFTAFVMIQAEPDKIAEIARSIANMPNVAEVYSVTGDFDILVVLRLSEFEQLAESVTDGLSRLDGILRTNTVLAFRRFSAEDLEAAWDIGVS